MQYNAEHGIVPRTVRKSVEQIMGQTSVLDIKGFDENSTYAVHAELQALTAAESPAEYQTASALEKAIRKTKKDMEEAAKNLDFMEAARLRDLLFELKQRQEKT